MPSRAKIALSHAFTRTRHYLHEYPEAGWAFVFGLMFEAIMALVGKGYPLWQGFFGGVGTSLMAASVFGLLTGMRQQYELQFSSLGIREIYTHRNKVSPDTQWCEWLANTRRQCVILGVSNSRWARDDAFPNAVRDVVRRRKTIKVFFLDPTGATAAVRTQEEMREGGRDTTTTIRGAINRMWRLREELDAAERVFFQLFVYEGTVTGTVWIDDFMIVTHYLPGSANVTSPALRIESTGGEDRDLYDIYKENALKIEENCSIEITEENVATYR